MKVLGNLLSLSAVLGTYYGAWQHSWIIIFICAIPQIIKIGYELGKINK